MTMPNFDALSNMPGVTFKKFCTFCSEEATGDIQFPLDPEDDQAPVETISLPVCEADAKKLLDKVSENMLD